MNRGTPSHQVLRANSALKVALALLLIAITVAPTFGTPLPESTVVIPRGSETTPGFGFQRIFENQQRHTYVFDPPELIAAMPEGGIITAIISPRAKNHSILMIGFSRPAHCFINERHSFSRASERSFVAK